ncbi:MAG TPA: hypothetical protein VHH73_05255 [Verrucomicrobiae bacterium]|nr:hypothetical protein [Verrucomicrobiae bacterium]
MTTTTASAGTFSGARVDAPAVARADQSRLLCLGAVLAVAGLPIGLLWDISWHISIGRDTFWTPAHLLIQVGGVIPAMLFAWQIAKTTLWGKPEDRAATVSFLGARGPLGAWVTIWGSCAMLTSAPFDDWWHNTYGLDVKIISPPHAVLGLGMFAVSLGVLLYVLSAENRDVRAGKPGVPWLFTIAAGLVLTMQAIFSTENTWPNHQHTTNFYRVISSVFPFLLVGVARASRLRWAATIAAATYTLLMLSLTWIFPLFPAQPKLAPIYNPVTSMVPPAFPILLIAPAVFIDLLAMAFGKQRVGREDEAAPVRPRWWKDWALALTSGFVFLAVAFPVQWYFSKFLISPAANNWFFAGSRIWPYSDRLGPWIHQFSELDVDPVTFRTLAFTVVFAAVSARLGLWCGNWMLKVRR